MTQRDETAALEPNEETLALCVAALERGEPVIVPTDTVYGLAARADDEVAIARIFELKQRPVDRSLAVLVADIEQAAPLAIIDPRSRLLMQEFWPGALTVVVEQREFVLEDFGAPDGTIGLRSPAHEFVRLLAQQVGPIAATSANRHREPTPPEAAGVAAVFGPGQLLVVDGGVLGGAASTVVDARVDPLIIHRAGPVTAEDLQRAFL